MYLVTGAAGFIGFHLSLKLLEKNKTVIGLDNFNDWLVPGTNVMLCSSGQETGKIYKYLGLTVVCVNSNTDHDKRLDEYKCNIVYATNNEIGFDFLRDNLKNNYESLCFKKMGYTIFLM